MSYQSDTLHRVLSSFPAGNRILRISPMPSSVKLHNTHFGLQSKGLHVQ